MILNGTTYSDKAPSEVKNALEGARLHGQRVRLFYGYRDTGQPWMEEWALTGRIGRSAGAAKVPILLANSRSTGGGAILDECVVAVLSSQGWLYRHPEFQVPDFSLGQECVDTPEGQRLLWEARHKGSVIARFEKQMQAERWVAFMRGERMGR